MIMIAEIIAAAIYRRRLLSKFTLSRLIMPTLVGGSLEIGCVTRISGFAQQYDALNCNGCLVTNAEAIVAEFSKSIISK